MRNKLLIIGASGHGKIVADIALKMGRWESIGFLDDNENLKSSMGIDVVGRSSNVSAHLEDCEIFVGIGNNATRKKIMEMLEAQGASIPTLIHPAAIVGDEVEISLGTVVMAGVVINCCTKIGKGCIINTGATIDHDNVIEDYVQVSPGSHLAGTVKIGEGTCLGIGTIVSNNISISNGCKVGAGAVVVKDIIEAGTYVGVPARRVQNEGSTDHKDK